MNNLEHFFIVWATYIHVQVKENEVLKANLESRKETLRELQLSLQKEVCRLSIEKTLPKQKYLCEIKKML